MKKRLSIMSVSFLLVLALIMPGAAVAAPFVTAEAPAASLAAPALGLVHPAPPLGNLGSGAPNVIDVNVASPGATIRTAEYQTIFPAASLIALEIFDQIPILPIPAPLAGAGAVADTEPVPVGLLPDGSVALFVIFGTVTAVDTDTGEWQIGEPPIFVYESADTGVRAPAVVGTEVRIVSTRTLAPGPVVAEVIVDLGVGSLPADPPIREKVFLFNGTVESEQTGFSSPGINMGGATWTIGGVPFQIDQAAIDPGIGMGSLVTVEFMVPPPVSTAVSEIALEIFGQVPSDIPATIHRRPRADPTEAPPGVPAGSWMLFVIAGRVSAVNAATGEWQIGSPPVFVYEAAPAGSTRIDDRDPDIGGGPPQVGDDVKIIAVRSLAPGPIVAERITFKGLDAPVAPPFVETAFLFNGAVEAMTLDAWTVGGVDFIISDPDFPAGIDPGLDVIGTLVTVEFMHAGPPAPAATLWARMALNTSSGLQTAVLNPPAVAGERPGFLFVRATDSLGQTTVGSFPANLLAVPLAPPAAPTILIGARTGNEVTLNWTDASLDEASFRVERASNDTFTLGRQTFIVAADNPTFVNTAPARGAVFYRVFAVSGAGDSLPSNSVSPVAPDRPVITAPRNGSAVATLTPTLGWDEVAATAPTVYDVEVTTARDARFAAPLVQVVGLAALTFDVPPATLGAGEMIRWRVRATNVFGVSTWAMGMFRTPMGPTPPRALTPRGVIDNVTPTLGWSAVAGAISYDVQVSSSRLFGAPLPVDVSVLAGATTFDVPPGALVGNTLYFWRVRVTTALGLSRWSAPGVFRTPFGPRIPPIPVAPRGIIDTLTPTLTWRILRDEATSFDVQVSTSRFFLPGTILVDVTGIAAPPFAPGVTGTFDVPPATLSAGTLYYWRARGVNAFGQSLWRIGFFRTR